MRKIIVSTFLLITFLAFYGCEGITFLEREIANQSATSITVTAVLDGGFNVNLTIDPNESESLFITDQLGGSSFAINPSIGISSMTIVNVGFDTLMKDYTVETNWESVIEETKKIPSQFDHTYTLIVQDVDF